MWPPADRSTGRGSHRSHVLKVFTITALSIIVTAGIILLLVWIIVKPREIVYTVEEGAISALDVRNNTLYAKFNFTVRAYNPNDKISMYYGPLNVEVSFDDQTITFVDMPGFYQRRRTSKRLDVYAEARGVQLTSTVADDLLKQKRSGEIDLDVIIKAPLKFKVGMWKSIEYDMNVVCSPVVVPLDPSVTFQITPCDYDI